MTGHRDEMAAVQKKFQFKLIRSHSDQMCGMDCNYFIMKINVKHEKIKEHQLNKVIEDYIYSIVVNTEA